MSVQIDTTAKKLVAELSVTDRLTGLWSRYRLDQVLRGRTDSCPDIPSHRHIACPELEDFT
jgi:hypothetical protein